MIAIYQTNQRALNLDEDASLKDILDVNKQKYCEWSRTSKN